MVVDATVLEVVKMVGDQMGVDSIFLEDFGHRIVERLQRSPTAVEEIVATGVQLAPSRDARHAAHITIVKSCSLFGQPREVDCLDRLAAVGRQHVTIEAIKHYHDGFHGVRFPQII